MEKQGFDEESTKQGEESKMTEKSNLTDKVAAVGWGLFFIWIGIAWLMNVGTGVGLLGVGIITLGIQVVRKSFNLKLEDVWIVVGALFVISGLWELLQIKMDLVPILIIVAGLALLVSIFRGKGR